MSSDTAMSKYTLLPFSHYYRGIYSSLQSDYPKDTSLPLSGNRANYYKAVLKHPHQVDIASHLWTRVTDTKIEKRRGIPNATTCI
jgi:hypothetical protein